MKKLFIFILFLLFIRVNFSFANQYLVENIKIYKEDVDSISARKIAITNGEREAFQILLKRLGIEESNYLLVEDKELTDMIKSIDINKEKVSKNSYQATLNIEFSEDYVQYILNKHKLTRLSQKVNSYLIIPVLEEENVFYSVEEANRWRIPFTNIVKNYKTIKLIELENTNSKFLKQKYFEEKKLSYFSPLYEKYNINNIVLVYGKFDYSDNILYIDVDTFDESESVENKTFQYKLKKNNTNRVFEDATKRIISYINQLNKEQKAKDNERNLKDNEAIIFIPISSIYDYVTATNTLNENRNIAKLRVKSLTKNMAEYIVQYRTSTYENFVDALKKSGLSVSDKKDGIYIYLK